MVDHSNPRKRKICLRKGNISTRDHALICCTPNQAPATALQTVIQTLTRHANSQIWSNMEKKKQTNKMMARYRWSRQKASTKICKNQVSEQYKISITQAMVTTKKNIMHKAVLLSHLYPFSDIFNLYSGRSSLAVLKSCISSASF